LETEKLISRDEGSSQASHEINNIYAMMDKICSPIIFLGDNEINNIGSLKIASQLTKKVNEWRKKSLKKIFLKNH